LRQGDPLASFLFLIVAEGLAGAVREASKRGFLDGLKIRNNEVEVSMFQFTDDTIFICKDNVKHCNY